MGHVIIAGRRFEITDVRLRGGEVKISFTIRGPAEPFSGPVTVFGEDGTGLWQGSEFRLRDGVPAGEDWACHYGMRLAEILGPRDPAEFDR